MFHQTLNVDEVKHYIKNNWVIYASNYPWRLYYNGEGQFMIANSITKFELVTNDIRVAIEKYNELN